MRKSAVALIVATLVCAALVGRAQQAVRPTSAAGDWPTYNHDLAATRFSPLTQITPENVSRLTQAWTFSLRPPGPPPQGAGSGARSQETGSELWVARLEANGNANPITYQGKNGKQYVAIVATDAVVVFSLP